MKYKAKKKKKKKDILSLRWNFFFIGKMGRDGIGSVSAPVINTVKKSNEWVGKLQIKKQKKK